MYHYACPISKPIEDFWWLSLHFVVKPQFPRTGYVASKHAMQGFFDTPHWVTVRCVGCVTGVCCKQISVVLGSRRATVGAKSPWWSKGNMTVEECVHQIVWAMERRKRAHHDVERQSDTLGKADSAGTGWSHCCLCCPRDNFRWEVIVSSSSPTPIQEKQGTQGCFAKIGAADDKVRTRVVHSSPCPNRIRSSGDITSRNYLAMRTLVFSLAIVIPTSGRNGERTRMGYSSLNDFSVGAAIWAELEKRCRLYLRLTNDSWRVDETCIVKGKQKYLYRAVDSAGQTLGFWLAVKRDTAAANFSTKPSKLSHSIATGD